MKVEKVKKILYRKRRDKMKGQKSLFLEILTPGRNIWIVKVGIKLKCMCCSCLCAHHHLFIAARVSQFSSKSTLRSSFYTSIQSLHSSSRFKKAFVRAQSASHFAWYCLDAACHIPVRVGVLPCEHTLWGSSVHASLCLSAILQQRKVKNVESGVTYIHQSPCSCCCCWWWSWRCTTRRDDRY